MADEAELMMEVVLGTYDSMLMVLSYDMLEENGKLLPKYHEKAHMGSIRCLGTSSTGILASGGTDEMIKLYNMRNHTEIGSINQHEGTVNCLEFYQDKYLFSCSEDGSVCVWNCTTWECVYQLNGHRGPVYCVAVHPTGTLALTVGKDKTVRTWNLSNGECAYIKKLRQVSELVLWNEIGDQYILVYHSSFTIYNVQSGELLLEVTVGKHINTIVFVRDNVIAVGSESHDIHIYSTQTGSIITSLTGHTNRVKSMAFVPGVDMLFSASSNGSVRVWELKEDLTQSYCISDTTVSGRLTCMTLVYPEELYSSNEKEIVKEKKVVRVKDSYLDKSLISKKKTKDETLTLQKTNEGVAQTSKQNNKETGKQTNKQQTSKQISAQVHERFPKGTRKSKRKRKRSSSSTSCQHKPTVTVEYDVEECDEDARPQKITKISKKKKTIVEIKDTYDDNNEQDLLIESTQDRGDNLVKRPGKKDSRRSLLLKRRQGKSFRKTL